MDIFRHIGRVCGTIRQIQERINGRPSRKEMALACNCTDSMIRLFENGNRLLSDDDEAEGKFTLYLEELGLPSESAALLKQMYDSQRDQVDLDAKLNDYGFDRIAVPNKITHPQLPPLVERLRKERLPAYIADELWFIHAFNAPIIRLFDLERRHLELPLMWHVITTKYFDQSPIRNRHKTPRNRYFTQAVELFFEAIAKYFFTQQATNLRECLFQLSPEEFWWKQWVPLVLMQTRDWEEEKTRDITFKTSGQEELTTWELGQSVEGPVKVNTLLGSSLEYRLVYWRPVGKATESIQQQIADEAVGKPVEFADSYGIPYDVKKWIRLSTS
jgi:hypothetical protein